MIEDTLFLDPQEAYRTACLRHRVQLTVAVTGLQVCFYLSERPLPLDPASQPENLVHIVPRTLVDFFVETRFRRPTRFEIPAVPGAPKEELLRSLVEQALLKRQQAAALVALGYRQRPAKKRDARLRILALTSRTTTVLQHTARALIDAFNRFGHEAHLIIERNDMEEHNALHLNTALAEFDPHIFVNVNNPNNGFLPPDVVNVLWWQDPPEALLEKTTLLWRPRDLVYSVVANFKQQIAATGIAPERIAVQPFCIDTSCFRVDPGSAPKRRNKVVFVGNSANPWGPANAGENALVALLTDRLEGGLPTTTEEVVVLGAKYGVAPYRAVYSLSYFVLRDLIVRWLCQTAGTKVEVYGRHWERDPVVAPFFRGELPHGEAVAAVYRGAKYALVLHPFSINSQRLAEVGACGCIPVVYDCRFQADRPFWEEQVIYFRTRQELAAGLRAKRPLAPDRFSQFFDYREFAKRILEDAAPLLPPLQ